MNTLMTKAILILFLTVAAVPSLAQQGGTVSFNYDANGNRVLRQIEIGGGRGEAATATIGATEAHGPLEVTLYPNPTEGRFSVGVDNAVENTRLQAVLYTAAGTVVSCKALSGDRIDFDLSGHTAGVYVLRIETGGETRTWKVIKH